MWIPEVPGVVSKTMQWEFDGTFVNDSWRHFRVVVYPPSPPVVEYYGSENYFKNSDLLTQENTHAWWTSGGFVPADTYHAHVGEHLLFDNGQQAVITEIGKFSMHRPRLTNFSNDDSEGPLKVQIGHAHASGTGACIEFGCAQSDSQDLLLIHPGPNYTVTIEAATPFTGDGGITQMANGYYKRDANETLSTHGEFMPDNSEWYDGPINILQRPLELKDYPNHNCLGQIEEMHWDFVDYFRFKPSQGPGPNIYVTLGTLNWHGYGTTSLQSLPNSIIKDYVDFPDPNEVWNPPYRLGAPVPNGDAGMDQQPDASDAFPEWEYIITNNN